VRARDRLLFGKSLLNAVARAFGRSAATYEKHARLQQRASRMLRERLIAFIGEASPTRIVDLGCGTGSFTKDIAVLYPRAELLACDIAEPMVEKTREALRSIAAPEGDSRREAFCADAEFATFLPMPDLIVSNLAMQWFSDPPASLAHHLRRTRFLAWTTLVEGTFATWIAAHAKHGLSPGVRDLVRAGEILRTCERLSPLRSTCSIDHIEECFPNAIEFLRRLRGLGAHTARPNHQPAPLREILRGFADGFTAEYRICTILVEMPS
jgi:malonyl-CoA O-methyltransferase